MKRRINHLLGYLGYELQRKRRAKSDVADSFPEASGLRAFFDKTEGMTSFEEACLLYELARAVSHASIVEVGSYRGRSAVALARGSLDGNNVPVYAIEPHEEFTGAMGGEFGPPDRGAFYRAMLDTGCYLVVRLVNLTSERVAPNWDKPIGLLWIDGDHSYDGVKRDFQCWEPHLTPNALIAFDDSIAPDLGPRKLIDELLADGRFEQLRQVGKVTVLRRRAD